MAAHEQALGRAGRAEEQQVLPGEQGEQRGLDGGLALEQVGGEVVAQGADLARARSPFVVMADSALLIGDEAQVELDADAGEGVGLADGEGAGRSGS